jgi:hypothetical protein
MGDPPTRRSVRYLVAIPDSFISRETAEKLDEELDTWFGVNEDNQSHLMTIEDVPFVYFLGSAKIKFYSFGHMTFLAEDLRDFIREDVGDRVPMLLSLSLPHNCGEHVFIELPRDYGEAIKDLVI